MSEINTQFNPEQLKAIKHIRGPLLIVAGAGTGKTTVIAEKIRFLIENRHLAPHRLLALTFTDKAAQEMLDRLDVVMPLGYQEPWISTFHSFADRILRAEGLEIGLDPSYKILSRSQQWILVKKHLFNFALRYFRPLGNPAKFITALLTLFSRAQDEAVTPEEFLIFAQKAKTKASSFADKDAAKKLLEVARAYATYQDLKITNSVLDFGDLITQTIRLFTSRPSVLKKYQQQFEHILVDEFQDTNYAQFKLIKLLAPARSGSNGPNLTVVGDDDQAIYKFRGAAVSNILEFKSAYPESKEIVLVKNYRSLPKILESAYQVIQRNNPDRLEIKLHLDKKLQSTRTKKTVNDPQIISLTSADDEVEWIIKKILELVAQENYTYKDFAILTRANSQLEPFVTSLRRHGIPYQLIGNRGLFDQEEVRTLLFFLQLVVNPHDSIALFQFLHTPIFNISAAKILSLISLAKARSVPLWEEVIVQKDSIFKAVINLIHQGQEQALRDLPTKLIYTFLTTTNFVKQFTLEDSVENELKIKNLNLFLRLLKNLETELKPTITPDIVDYLNLLEEAGENPAQAEIEDIDTVRLITIHSAKGLEFPVVFLPSLITGRFPAINRRDPIEFPDALIKEKLPQNDAALQEERRLFYVGLTRARDYLYLTYAADYGGVHTRHPSGFLTETKLPCEEISYDQPSLLSTTSAPKAAKITAGKVEFAYVSYSQIDTFKTCPLKYKYRYVLQVPAAPHHALSFGQSIHDTLKHFHLEEMKGFKPTLKDLLSLYQQYFRDEGYDSIEHKKQRFIKGQQALRQYFKVYKQKLGTPIELEKGFRLTIAGVPLVGKIDRLDKVGDKFEIVDYKTGDQTTKNVDKDEQLTIYALGAKHSLNLKVQQLSLYFLETNQKVSTTRSDKDLDNFLKYLEKQVKDIKSSHFPASPGYPFPCGFCEYARICPFVSKKR